MSHDLSVSRVTPSPSRLPGLGAPSSAPAQAASAAPDRFVARRPSEAIAFGAAGGLGVGTMFAFGLVLVAGGADALSLGALSALVLTGCTAAGALMGGAAALVGCAAVAVANRLSALRSTP